MKTYEVFLKKTCGNNSSYVSIGKGDSFKSPKMLAFHTRQSLEKKGYVKPFVIVKECK